ncbi:MAG: hypothetical protein H0T58_05520 [Gemmatimonadales bacterium]|nr:hypothetical protein [Gemmatimonadales bacterium]
MTTYLYEHEDREARQREDEVRKGKHAFVVAAEKTSDLAGIRLSETQQQRLGVAYHWGLGLGAGAVYAPFVGASGGSTGAKAPLSVSSSSYWWTKR